MILTLFSLTALFALAVILFLQHPKFGKLPSGERLERIKQSPNYRDGELQNLSDTPALTEGASYFSLINEFFFTKKDRVNPTDVIPSTKVDLLNLNPDEDILVWFGHSSYFIQIDGKKVLVDPVFGKAASPLSFTTNAFEGTNRYTAADMPEIDYLFISHDHWDHLDYETLLEMKSKIGTIICGLGVGEHFEYWGFDKDRIIERDWNEEIPLDPGFTAFTTPARHFAGRGFARNKALWTSFVFKTPTHNFYFGGDSGYDSHFAEIGKNHGPFDLAFLENGQYDKSWKYIHMQPEEMLQAAKDLGVKNLFSVHSAKFPLANHPWDEPLKRISALTSDTDIRLVTPIIGEFVFLKDSTQQFTNWWEGIE
tara:strand:+ start:33690 stop:34790 length:1101 start_codon:yes stop_codon:yes gene_type:complete